MKKVMIIIACIASLGLCKAQEGFRITGNLGQLQQDTFYLVVPNLNQTINILGVSVVKDGNIEFQGTVQEPVFACIMTSDRQGSIPLMLENTNYRIRIGADQMIVEGGVEQEAFNEFSKLQREAMRQQQKLQTDMKSAYEEGNQMRVSALSGQAQKLMQDMQKQQTGIVKRHADTYTAAYIVLTSGMQAPPEQLKSLYNLLGDRARASMYGKIVAARLTDLARTAVDQIAPDFTVTSPEGKPVSLYGIQGKVKLIDFWASWCGPCRAENPNVVKIYKKYHDKGLEVLSVSIDKDRSAWVKALMEDGLPWLNGIDEKSQAAQLYGVSAIPHTVLLDGNNRIVAKNLRGRELARKIEELLKTE